MRECPVVAEFVDKVGGEEALLAMSRRRPNLRNGVATAIEEAVAELAVEQPAWGQVRMRQRAGQAREKMIAAEWPTDTGNQADSQAAVRSDPGFYIWPLRGPFSRSSRVPSSSHIRAVSHRSMYHSGRYPRCAERRSYVTFNWVNRADR